MHAGRFPRPALPRNLREGWSERPLSPLKRASTPPLGKGFPQPPLAAISFRTPDTAYLQDDGDSHPAMHAGAENLPPPRFAARSAAQPVVPSQLGGRRGEEEAHDLREPAALLASISAEESAGCR